MNEADSENQCKIFYNFHYFSKLTKLDQGIKLFYTTNTVQHPLIMHSCKKYADRKRSTAEFLELMYENFVPLKLF